MSILGRLSGVLGANIHGLIDRAEVPERMLAQVLRTLEARLEAAQRLAARALAGERSLRREYDQARCAAKRWQEQARFALSQGREDLARGALKHKIDQDGRAAAVEDQVHEAARHGAELKTALQKLRMHLAQARQRLVLIQVRQRSAEARLEVSRTLRSTQIGDPLDQWERMFAEREDDLLARLEVSQWENELEGDLAALEMEKRVQKELDGLVKE